MSAAWNDVKVVDVQRVKIDNEAIFVGSTYRFEVTLDVGSLRAEDIGVELVVAQQIVGGRSVEVVATQPLHRTGAEGSRVTYALDYVPDRTGTFDVAMRIHPTHPRLPHRMDFALVKWA